MKKLNSIKEELLYLEKRYGILDPKMVLDFASNEDTHLHSKFEWDDSKASYEYRLIQARKIIRLELEVISNDKVEMRTKLFVSLKKDRRPGGGYRNIISVMSDDDRRTMLLEEAMAELARLRAKYSHLEELASIFAEVKKAEMLIMKSA